MTKKLIKAYKSGKYDDVLYTLMFVLAGAFAILCRSSIGVTLAIIGMFITSLFCPSGSDKTK
jgi:hypothetical protein